MAQPVRPMLGLTGVMLLAVVNVALLPTQVNCNARPSTQGPPSQSIQEQPLTFQREMLAGAVARSAAQCLMYPADVMKTLAQTRSKIQGLSIYEMGLGRLVYGAITTSIMALPAGALQFSIFPLAKRTGRSLMPWISTTPLELMSGVCASFVACFVQTPQEVVKQRLQTGIYPSFVGGIATIARTEGVRGFFTAFAPTLARNAPTVCISFTSFSRLKAWYEESYGRPPGRAENFVLGAIGAGFAVVLTQPIDVVKTRLMTQASSKLFPYKSVSDCLTRMLREEGPLSLVRGLLPRLLYVAPFGAVQFAVNEQMRVLLRPSRLPSVANATAEQHTDL